jgi:hypothetical protein
LFLFFSYFPKQTVVVGKVPERFASLSGRCFFHEERQSTYRMCFFSAHQISRDGTVINFGDLTSWDSGPNDEYFTISYLHGDMCSDGQRSSLTVKLQHGMEHGIVYVRKHMRCHYEMIFQTPLSTFNELIDKDEL